MTRRRFGATWGPLLSVGLIGALLFATHRQDPRLSPSPRWHQPAPDLTSQGVSWAGHWSLWVIFSSRCGSCLAEQPVLCDHAQTPHLVLYGLAYRDSEQNAAAWLAQYGNPFYRVYADPTGHRAREWGAFSTPEIFLINPQGIVEWHHRGPLTSDLWDHEITGRIL